MTDDRMALIEASRKADDGNFLRSPPETVLQFLMEEDVDGLIGAGRYERRLLRAVPVRGIAVLKHSVGGRWLRPDSRLLVQARRG